MRLKLSKIAILLLPVMASAFGASEMIVNEAQNSIATEAYWTPERLRNAQALDLPIVQDHTQLTKLDSSVLQSQSSHVKKDVPPTASVKIDSTQIFKPRITKNEAMLDAGTLNQQFSSQPLVPITADLSYPYSAVGKLFFTTPSGDKFCSAFVLGKRVVVTAAHCMHSGVAGSPMYGNLIFIPAYRNGTAPYQKWPATNRVLYAAWVSGGKIPSKVDYAVFNVADQTINGAVKSLGDVVGVLGYKLNSAIPNHVHILGYPGNLDSGERMHQVTAQSAQAVEPGNVEYGSDMSIGAGGGPLIQNFSAASAGTVGGKNSGRNLVVGVTSYGYNDNTSFGNGSVILDQSFEALYTYMCGNGNC